VCAGSPVAEMWRDRTTGVEHAFAQNGLLKGSGGGVHNRDGVHNRGWVTLRGVESSRY
jgi:hypothetical protein